jgi:hypothetical protein
MFELVVWYRLHVGYTKTQTLVKKDHICSCSACTFTLPSFWFLLGVHKEKKRGTVTVGITM